MVCNNGISNIISFFLEGIPNFTLLCNKRFTHYSFYNTLSILRHTYFLLFYAAPEGLRNFYDTFCLHPLHWFLGLGGQDGMWSSTIFSLKIKLPAEKEHHCTSSMH